MSKKWRVRTLEIRLERLAANINSATQYFNRHGKAIPFGVLNVPTPNTDPRRIPNPFTGGN